MSKIIEDYIKREMGGVVLLPEFWLRTLLCYLTANEENNCRLQSTDPIGGYKGSSDNNTYDSSEEWTAIEIGCTFEAGTIIFKVDDDDLPVADYDGYIPNAEEFEAWLAVHDSDFDFDEESTRELELFILDPELNALKLSVIIADKGPEHGLFRMNASQGKVSLWITSRALEGFDSGKPMLLDKLKLKARKNKQTRIEQIAITLTDEFKIPDYTLTSITGHRGYVVVNIYV